MQSESTHRHAGHTTCSPTEYYRHNNNIKCKRNTLVILLFTINETENMATVHTRIKPVKYYKTRWYWSFRGPAKFSSLVCRAKHSSALLRINLGKLIILLLHKRPPSWAMLNITIVQNPFSTNVCIHSMYITCMSCTTPCEAPGNPWTESRRNPRQDVLGVNPPRQEADEEGAVYSFITA
jgi:hypothetical protein